MGVRVAGGAEGVDEGDGADQGGRACAGASRLKRLFDDAPHDARCGAADRWVAPREVAQALGKRDDPLAHREGGEDVVHQMQDPCRARPSRGG
jgi:hypothetical protein